MTFPSRIVRLDAPTWVIVALVACQLSAGGFAMAADPLPSVAGLGRVAPATLPTTDGKTVQLSEFGENSFTVLCFLGTECPLAKVYGPRLNRLAERFAAEGVRFVGVDSNLQDTMEELRAYAARHDIGFPLAKDFDQTVARQVGATRTPEVFIYDEFGNVHYRGRIDDQYQPGVARERADVDDLHRALEEIVAGKPVTMPVTEAVGCLISFPKTTPSDASPEVTYCDQVSRVLQRHCVECHRPGAIGPFALTDYDEIVGWADMILEVVDQGRMPPWHAAPTDRPFANARQMDESDKEILRRWVDAGTPYGNPEKLPPQPEFLSGWQLPETPQLVLPISDQPFRVPAEGTVEYQYFVVDPGFETDRWVRAAEVRPGNAAVVHHCIAFTRPPDGNDLRGFGILAAFVPGQRPTVLPPGFARRVRAGSKIIFQMHYTPIGSPEQDLSRLGLLFADAEQVTHEVSARGGIEHDFEIPPHASRHLVEGQIGSLPQHGLLLSLMPHMHLRGRSFRVIAQRDEAAETLLNVPAYDFNWQHNYRFVDPVPLRDIDRLRFEAVFDNSAENPFNPDPTETVTWGDQTWQEMALAFADVAVPVSAGDAAEAAVEVEAVAEEPSPQTAQDAAKRNAAEAFADDYLAKFDANGDRAVSRDEVPNSVRLFGFHQFDHNGDGRLDRDELIREALARSTAR